MQAGDVRDGLTAADLDGVQGAGGGGAVGGAGQGDFLGDGAGGEERGDGGVEGGHAVGRALFHDIGETEAADLAGGDAFPGPEGGGQHFDRGHPAAADFGQEALGQDVAQAAGQPGPGQGLVLGTEKGEQAFHGRGAIGGMGRGQDEVAGLGGGERRFDGLPIPDFAHEDDVGGLAQGGAQSFGEAREIRAEFALGDVAEARRLEKFHRVLQGDGVDGAGAHDGGEQGGQGRGFARARGPDHEDEPVGQADHPVYA